MLLCFYGKEWFYRNVRQAGGTEYTYELSLLYLWFRGNEIVFYRWDEFWFGWRLLIKGTFNVSHGPRHRANFRFLQNWEGYALGPLLPVSIIISYLKFGCVYSEINKYNNHRYFRLLFCFLHITEGSYSAATPRREINCIFYPRKLFLLNIDGEYWWWPA